MSLLRGEHSLTVVNAADQALDIFRRINRGLQAMGVHDFRQFEVSEDDLVSTGKIRPISDEISWRLRNLARNLLLDIELSGNSQDLATLAGLVTLLEQMPAAANQEPVKR